MMILMERT
jgi:hypothetical protein